jgi:O-antigen/teichoic acid export membrane protein
MTVTDRMGKKTARRYFNDVSSYVIRRAPVMQRGALAILDQFLISGSNFAVGIILARWLSGEQYGTYALTFSIFLLLSQIHQALLLEPQSVLGPAQFAAHLKRYLGALLWLCIGSTLAIAVGLVIISGVVGAVGHAPGLPSALIGIGAAAPAILLFWLLRGACYVKLASGTALLGSSIYCAALLLSFTVLRALHAVSPASAYLAMGIAALSAGAFLLWQLKPIMGRGSGSEIGVSSVAAEHWTYGRWALASALVTWLPWNSYYTVLAHFQTMEAAGQYRAIMNFFLPLGQMLSALSLLAHPIVAGKFERAGESGVLGQGREIAAIYGAGAIVYWLLVMWLRRPLFSLLYGGRFQNMEDLLPWFALASLFWFAGFAPPIALRAVQSPASVCVLYGAASAVTLIVGIPAAKMFGIPGVIAGTLLSSIAALGSGLFIIHTKMRRIAADTIVTSASPGLT